MLDYGANTLKYFNCYIGESNKRCYVLKTKEEYEIVCLTYAFIVFIVFVIRPFFVLTLILFYFRKIKFQLLKINVTTIILDWMNLWIQFLFFHQILISQWKVFLFFLL